MKIKNTGLTAIKLLSMIFVLVIQNCPIRTKNLLNAVFWLAGFFSLEYEYKLVLKILMTARLDVWSRSYSIKHSQSYQFLKFCKFYWYNSVCFMKRDQLPQCLSIFNSVTLLLKLLLKKNDWKNVIN